MIEHKTTVEWKIVQDSTGYTVRVCCGLLVVDN